METTTINLLPCRLNQFQMIFKTYFTFSDIMNRDRKSVHAPGDAIRKGQENSQYAVMMIVLRRKPCTEPGY